MDEHGKLYWHEDFYEALQLELYEYRDALKFIYEHQLSKETLRMDVLVIKKDENIKIEKNIGRIFKVGFVFGVGLQQSSRVRIFLFVIWKNSHVRNHAVRFVDDASRETHEILGQVG